MNQSNFFEVNEINVTEKLGAGYIDLIEDVTRTFIIQLVVQFMFFVRSPSVYSIFDTEFIETLFYLVLGLCGYWLIFKRLVHFK